MTRQLLRQALAVLQDVNIDAMDRSMGDRVSDTAFAIFTALLHTPEPASVLWVMTTPLNGRKVVIESESEAKRFAAMGDRNVVPFYAPDTLTQSTHEADMSKKDAEIDRLHEYFTDMTAQRDRLMWGHAQVCEKADADRLDAQRYRKSLEAMYPALGNGAWPHEVMDAVTAEEFTAAIDAAIATGGQA